MLNNLKSLSLLRNGKVYANKELAKQGLIQTATNDGVAKLARYLDPVLGGDPIIRTLVGFYANAAEMEDAGGGVSSYTILDIDGSSSEISSLSASVETINSIIGNGIPDTTLTAAIGEVNSKFGNDITTANTVSDALEALSSALTSALTVTVEASESADYAKVYTIKQGGVAVGTINIPKDMVIKSGSIVKGTWSGDTFIEDPAGEDIAIKLVLSNDDVIYLNAKDLVDIYTAGNGISIENNEVSVKLDENGEAFLTVGEDGVKLFGVQAAIDKAVDDAKLVASDGINILPSNKIKAVAALNSGYGVNNPIKVDESGIKFAENLDCGFFDDNVVIATTASDIANVSDPSDTSVVLTNKATANAMTANKVFKDITLMDTPISDTITLAATDEIEVDSVEVSGSKDGSRNGKINFTANTVVISNVSVADGSTVYNVFEGDQSSAKLESFTAFNIKVDNPSLLHNVFNIYQPKDNCEIIIKDSNFNLTVDNSNVLRVSNYSNAENVSVVFEDVNWTYENSLSSEDWGWAGLVIYQPAMGDHGLANNLDEMKTWSFKFKNCSYNGVKIDSNNFGEHNQVFYAYNLGNDGSIKDPVALGFNVVFE